MSVPQEHKCAKRNGWSGQYGRIGGVGWRIPALFGKADWLRSLVENKNGAQTETVQKAVADAGFEGRPVLEELGAKRLKRGHSPEEIKGIPFLRKPFRVDSFKQWRRARHQAGTVTLLSDGGAWLNPLDNGIGEFTDWKIGAFGGKSSQLFHVARLWINYSQNDVQHAQYHLCHCVRLWHDTLIIKSTPRQGNS